jgi:hypothetical protein
LLAKVKDASANLLQAIARDPPGRRADIGDFSRGHDFHQNVWNSPKRGLKNTAAALYLLVQ